MYDLLAATSIQGTFHSARSHCYVAIRLDTNTVREGALWASHPGLLSALFPFHVHVPSTTQDRRFLVH